MALTLEDAVRRAIDNNLEIAVERLNPQTFDFTLASLRANYKPVATSTLRPARQRAAADQPAEPRQPERVDDDLQLGRGAEPAVGRRQHGVLTFNNARIVSPTDRLASFDPQFNSSYLFSYTQPLLRGFRIDQTRQQMQTTVINRDNAELNLKARTTNTLAAGARSLLGLRVYDSGGRRRQQSLALASKLLSRQQDSRRSRHDGADGCRAGRSRRGDAPAGAHDGDRDDAHGRARARSG